MEYKIILWFISSFLAIVWYLPYIRDTVKKKTTPHIYTWGLWWILAAVIFIIQVQNQWWAWSWVTGITSIICFVIVIISLKFSEKNIKRSDTLSLIAALIAIYLWYFLENPLYSLTLILIIETLAFYPTFRKSLKRPHQETISTYLIASVRSVISIFALENINIINIAFPFYLVLVYWGFALLLIYLRRKNPII